ncbi:MAG: carboxypeptidase-like regulatory domain-containing protein, partial [Bacteroidia bacterium]
MTTRVTGKVYDVETLEPLPFVNVAFKGTNIGTACDVEGKFTMTTVQKVDSVMAIYIGYAPTVMAIKYGQVQNINIPLKKASFTTKEVVITPGENPAFRILRGVWAHKPENDKEKLSAYEYEVYNKLEFDLNNIDEDFKK